MRLHKNLLNGRKSFNITADFACTTILKLRSFNAYLDVRGKREIYRELLLQQRQCKPQIFVVVGISSVEDKEKSLF